MKKVLFGLLVLSAYLFGFSPESKTAIEAALKEEYAREYKDPIFASIKVESASKDEAKGYFFKGIEISPQNLTKNRGAGSAIFENSDGKVKKLFFRYELDVEIEVLKAVSNLQKDKIIDLREVTVERIKLKNLYAKPLKKESLKNLAAKRLIRAGSVITAQDVGEASAIKKGSSVNVVVIADFLEVETAGVALEDGEIGEHINVKTKNGKVMRAYISSPYRLEVR